jgi:hypothetical protein
MYGVLHCRHLEDGEDVIDRPRYHARALSRVRSAFHRVGLAGPGLPVRKYRAVKAFQYLIYNGCHSVLINLQLDAINFFFPPSYKSRGRRKQ